MVYWFRHPHLDILCFTIPFCDVLCYTKLYTISCYTFCSQPQVEAASPSVSVQWIWQPHLTALCYTPLYEIEVGIPISFKRLYVESQFHYNAWGGGELFMISDLPGWDGSGYSLGAQFFWCRSVTCTRWAYAEIHSRKKAWSNILDCGSNQHPFKRDGEATSIFVEENIRSHSMRSIA